MATSATELSIANRALLSVGARAQVSSISPSDGSVEGNALSVLWAPTFEALARTAPWNCLRKQITLSMIAAATGTPENPDGTTLPLPPAPWLYSYSLPPDCLFFRSILPTFPFADGTTTPSTTVNNNAGTWLPNTGGQIPYVVTSAQDANQNPIEVVLTNQEAAIGIYTANLQEPSLWDSNFQAAMVASLAAYLVPALSLNLPLMQMSVVNAEKAITNARTRDGNEGVTTMDHLPDWMQARLGGSGYGLGYNFTSYNGYVSMVWPTYWSA